MPLKPVIIITDVTEMNLTEMKPESENRRAKNDENGKLETGNFFCYE